MATRKIFCTAAAALRSAAYSSPRCQLRRTATTGLLLSMIGSTKNLFPAKYPFKSEGIIFGKKGYSLHYSTVAEKSSPPPCQDVTFWNQLFKKVHTSAKTVKDAIQATNVCQDVIEQGKCEALHNYGYDITELARRGKLDLILGWEDEIDRCIQILSRKTKNNPIVIGDSWLGCTDFVIGLAQRIVDGDVPETLVNRKLIQLHTDSLLADTKSREHFEQRLEAVLKEITASNDQNIIFFHGIHTILGAGGRQGGVNVGNLLNSMLGGGDLQIVATITWSDYRKFFRNLDIACRFEKVATEDGVGILSFESLADVLFMAFR
ncbi:hypothetical protein Vadar_014017 [Vaccinium darrowii]|uniref:Uncharacterized protein n=1 Tax=Vaccinium darrowii TaxID=229202 RepID=A0ACB7XZ50_9ERIC|nr:hypothetical protein Vadar_014017 [Vaccinium darrowii]